MGKTRPPYPREYREEAVRLVRESGKSIGQIAISRHGNSLFVRAHPFCSGVIPSTANPTGQLAA